MVKIEAGRPAEKSLGIFVIFYREGQLKVLFPGYIRWIGRDDIVWRGQVGVIRKRGIKKAAKRRLECILGKVLIIRWRNTTMAGVICRKLDGMCRYIHTVGMKAAWRKEVTEEEWNTTGARAKIQDIFWR